MTLLHFAIELKLYDLAILLIGEYRFDRKNRPQERL